MNPQNQQFGAESVRRTLLAAPRTVPEVGEAMLKALRAHASGRPRSDDIAWSASAETADPVIRRNAK